LHLIWRLLPKCFLIDSQNYLSFSFPISTLAYMSCFRYKNGSKRASVPAYIIISLKRGLILQSDLWKSLLIFWDKNNSANNFNDGDLFFGFKIPYILDVSTTDLKESTWKSSPIHFKSWSYEWNTLILSSSTKIYWRKDLICSFYILRASMRKVLPSPETWTKQTNYSLELLKCSISIPISLHDLKWLFIYSRSIKFSTIFIFSVTSEILNFTIKIRLIVQGHAWYVEVCFFLWKVVFQQVIQVKTKLSHRKQDSRRMSIIFNVEWVFIFGYVNFKLFLI